MSKHAKKFDVVASATGQIHLLLVDDEEDITIYLQKALERKGILVTVFNDPAVALSAFKAGQYDLAVVDIRMPGMNGYELVSKLKSIDKKLKICFLTAFEIENEDLIQNNVAGAVDCSIKKPVSLSDFVKRVNSLLE